MIRSILTLARWLGPWAAAARIPEGIVTEEDFAGQLRVRLYRPRRTPRATMLVAPGLHYAGADDPRLDRFCRVLAAAGHLVVAPFIPDYLALTPTARAISDFEYIYKSLPKWSAQKPYIFSISFGSLLAFSLAAAHPGELAGLIIFGGYAGLPKALRFCMTGEAESGRRAVRDPLNQPVVLANLLAHFDPPAKDPAALTAAWRRYCEQTWGRPELKAPERYIPIANELAGKVPESIRELFLIGTGALPGAAALVEAALAKMGGAPGELDPSPYLSRVQGRVELVHGADDDVIPFEQSHALAAALTAAQARVHITGLYGHTGASGGALKNPLAALGELKTMLAILRVLAA